MGQKIDRTYLFERMPVGQAVRRQIIPSIASQMVILLYNLADTYFVGLLNDAAQTAAVSLAYSVTLLMTALANLFAVGGAGRIAQLLGRRDRDGAREVCAVSFWFALLASAAFCVLFTLLSSPILRLCGATDETYALACGYSRWVISVGGTFSILNTVLANLIRADGSAFAASMGVSAGGIINMLLDPLFVLPRFLGMGAEGAGLATAISNAAGMLILLGIIAARRRVGVVALRPGDLRATRRHIGRILRIGLPSAVQFLLTLVAVGALTKFMSLYDTAAVAASSKSLTCCRSTSPSALPTACCRCWRITTAPKTTSGDTGFSSAAARSRSASRSSASRGTRCSPRRSCGFSSAMRRRSPTARSCCGSWCWPCR